LENEEEKIGAMYFRLWFGSLRNLWQRMFGREFRRTGGPIVLVVLLLVLAPTVVWVLHIHGGFSKAKRDIKERVVPGSDLENAVGSPGGLAPIVLKANGSGSAQEPEFVSATLFPGQGMRVFQISANLPDSGPLDLLDQPSVKALTDGPLPTPHGSNNDYGALEVPWGGWISGVGTPFGTSIRAMWRGIAIEESSETSATPTTAEGGNLRTTRADEHAQSATATGSIAHVKFRDLNWDDRWPSKTDVSVEVALSPKVLDLTVLARNSGDTAEPMGIGWNPRFTASGDQQKLELKLPGGDVMEFDPAGVLPTGIASSNPAGIARFRSGAALGAQSVNVGLFHLTSSGGSGPSVELVNRVLGYGLRMTALSPTIREIRVSSPATDGYVGLGMQTNYDDPFGKEWNEDGIHVLEPGQLLEWKVRLEIFAVPKQ